MPTKSQQKTNRLSNEKSPYLLQHASNPVAWFPWSDEAFALAREQNKLIFLSIGYSTCHWCHVMAAECFENPEIAAFLNRHFIAIKVDREERPDIDQFFVRVALAMNGNAGWPLNVFLLPDRTPFLAGTYFPPVDRPGQPGLLTVLTDLNRAWTLEPQKIREAGSRITAALAKPASPGDLGPLAPDRIAERAFQQLASRYDQVYGGFGPAPKFPGAAGLGFLLRHQARTRPEPGLTMAATTLKKMAQGGIYDQLGGGFHRYSVDSQWRTPHFEKMLYDQAQLAIAYLEAFQVTEQPGFAATACGILDYVLRDLTGPAGGFYSAEDADSPAPENPDRHGEGLFYTWTGLELQKILGPEDFEVASFHFGFRAEGNALLDPSGELAGRNILYLARSPENTARHFNQALPAITARLDAIRQKLLAARAQRPRPHRDDKIIAAWNGLTISALARGYQAFDRPDYLAAARQAALFIQKNMYVPETRTLSRRYRDGSAGIAGFLVDYAFVVQGLLDLFEATFDPEWLDFALLLTETQIALFADPAAGGFFDTAGAEPGLGRRAKSDYDAAEPTGNSVAALNLYRLAQLTDNHRYRDLADSTLKAFGQRLRDSPLAMPQMLIALDFQMDKPTQIVIAGSPTAADTQKMLRAVRRIFLPRKIVLLADGGENQKKLSGHLPFLTFVEPLQGRATAYVCKNYACQRPTTEIAEMLRQLKN